jgi:flagellar biosynthesis/type III secretory pathway M-ring protein FliF/YscJ
MSPPSESVFQQQPINSQPITERPIQHNPPTFNPPPPEQRPVVIYRKDAGSGWIFFTLLCILVIVVFAWLVYECVKQHRIKRAQQNRAANNNIIASEPVIIAHAQPRTVQLNEGGERNLSLSGDHKDNMEHDDLQTDERLKERMAKQASV